MNAPTGLAIRTPAFLLWADRQLGRLAGLVAIVGGLAVVGLIGVTITAVIWRYWFRNPIFGIEDISQMVLVFVAGSAVAYGARHQAHVSVNLIGGIFGRRFTRWTDAIMRTLTLAILILSVHALITKACGVDRACVTSNFSIEHRPYYYFLAVSMGVYAANVALQLVIGLWHFAGDDPNPIPD